MTFPAEQLCQECDPKSELYNPSRDVTTACVCGTWNDAAPEKGCACIAPQRPCCMSYITVKKPREEPRKQLADFVAKYEEPSPPAQEKPGVAKGEILPPICCDVVMSRIPYRTAYRCGACGNEVSMRELEQCVGVAQEKVRQLNQMDREFTQEKAAVPDAGDCDAPGCYAVGTHWNDQKRRCIAHAAGPGWESIAAPREEPKPLPAACVSCGAEAGYVTMVEDGRCFDCPPPYVASLVTTEYRCDVCQDWKPLRHDCDHPEPPKPPPRGWDRKFNLFPEA